MLGDDQLQHGVAEELEALIIKVMPLGFVPEARMSERLGEQQRVAKFVADAFLELVQRRKRIAFAAIFQKPTPARYF
jgi:hypothetical protein